MKYDHIVKANGQYYPSGTDVPEIIDFKLDDVENTINNSKEKLGSTINKRGRTRQK